VVACGGPRTDGRGRRILRDRLKIPVVWFGDAGFAKRTAREWNEYAAAVVRDHPGRFGFFAVIAPPDIEGASAGTLVLSNAVAVVTAPRVRSATSLPKVASPVPETALCGYSVAICHTT